MEEYKVKQNIPTPYLDISSQFEKLTKDERLYAYWLQRASWSGALITARQISPESEDLILFFNNLFKKMDPEKVYDTIQNSVSKAAADGFFNYVAYVFGNMGNYLSFGDKKFIPSLGRKVFKQCIESIDSSLLKEYMGLEQAIFSVDRHNKILGYPPNGITTYYSPNMTKEEVDTIDRFMMKNKMEPWNTRVEKKGGDPTVYVIKVASCNSSIAANCHQFEGLLISVIEGDHSNYLKNVVSNLEEVVKYAKGYQVDMINHYIHHFKYGLIEDHKKSQISWIKDIGPTVETNMGFIENYRDPQGVRSEFEAFVAIVDKEVSKNFEKLVNSAPELLKLLPWPDTFEKDKFLKPDFTSLEILTFVGSGIPAGINIPNYDDIRQNIGFKNVSLGNIIRVGYTSDEPTPHLEPDDDLIFKKHVVTAFTTDVGGHELLGHGSGKLFYAGNFDPNMINPLTGNLIKSWYKEGETYSSKFGSLGNPYEECRAECVGLFFSTNKVIHQIFGYKEEDADDIVFVNWLWMILAGIKGLEAYNPDSERWTQAHSQARYVIYRVLSEVDGFIQVVEQDESFVVRVDRSKIMTEGLPHLEKFLLRLQVYKTTGNINEAAKMFEHYSDVNEYHLKIRDMVNSKKKPRPVYVQPSLTINGDSVQVVSYPSTNVGLIQSFIDNLVV